MLISPSSSFLEGELLKSRGGVFNILAPILLNLVILLWSMRDCRRFYPVRRKKINCLPMNDIRENIIKTTENLKIIENFYSNSLIHELLFFGK